MFNHPFLSIIIPIFNRQDLIEECVQSILAQTENDWEVIIVDDGSTDRTWEVLQKFQSQDKRIRIYKREGEPKGANRCRNQGIEKSEGKYLFFLDSDDLLGPSFLFTRKKYASLFPDLDMLAFPEANFKNIPTHYYFKQTFIRKQNEDDLMRFLQRDSPWLTSGPILKKCIFQHRIKFNESLTSGQDWDFFIRLFIYGVTYKKIDISDEPDFFHRMDKSYPSITNSNSMAIWFSNKEIGIESLLPLFKEKGYFKSSNPYRRAILEYYMWFCKQNADIGRNTDSLRLWKFFRQQKTVSWLEWIIWAIYLHRFMYGRGRMKRYYLALVTSLFPKWNYIRLAM